MRSEEDGGYSVSAPRHEHFYHHNDAVGRLQMGLRTPAKTPTLRNDAQREQHNAFDCQQGGLTHCAKLSLQLRRIQNPQLMTEGDRITDQAAVTFGDSYACRQRRTPQIRGQWDGQSCRAEIAHQVILKDEYRTDSSLLRTADGIEIRHPNFAALDGPRVSSLSNPFA